MSSLDLDEMEERANDSLRSYDDGMVKIGKGNPYLHCRHCGVTNVQLNSGAHSRQHADYCPIQKQVSFPRDVLSLVAEVRRLREKCGEPE